MRYAIIGFGPVGSSIGAQAVRLGHDVVWYDPSPTVTSAFRRAPSIAEAASGADRLVSAVPGPAATSVFDAAAPAFTDRLVYEDWSSAVPDVKRRLGNIGGVRYVDVTLLDSITASQPLLCLAGEHADAIALELRDLGFAAIVAGASPGDAAVVKMVRSTFMKPFEALAIELVRTSARWDPSGAAIASIERTLQTDFRDLAAMLLETNRRHVARRREELDSAMGSVGLPSGRGLLDATRDYFDALHEAWAQPKAPPAGAGEGSLVAFLARDAEQQG
jgi:3-hydroxyisobutyrate dehydrogenase-like beta-hydroxyacid dehydrogenase